MKKFFAIFGIVAVVVGIVLLVVFRSGGEEVIDTADRIYKASDATGGIGEKIIGDADKADLIIYEYADFGCSHCAEWNKKINELVEKYDGRLAVVFRSFNLGFKNGEAAARAATAAQIQGYFKEYKDLLFKNQAEWFYAEDDLEDIFVSYFETASNGNGNATKFVEDMKSRNVEKRNSFENKMGKKVNLEGTPLFRIDGEMVPLDELVGEIEKRL